MPAAPSVVSARLLFRRRTSPLVSRNRLPFPDVRLYLDGFRSRRAALIRLYVFNLSRLLVDPGVSLNQMARPRLLTLR